MDTVFHLQVKYADLRATVDEDAWFPLFTGGSEDEVVDKFYALRNQDAFSEARVVRTESKVVRVL